MMAKYEDTKLYFLRRNAKEQQEKQKNENRHFGISKKQFSHTHTHRHLEKFKNSIEFKLSVPTKKGHLHI